MATPTDNYFDGMLAPDPTPINAFSTFETDPEAPTPFPNDVSPTATASPQNAAEDRHNNGVLNYYFLLLAFVIILLGILYLVIARRKRQKLAQRRQNGQRALARDLERWGGGGPWGPGRFRMPRSSGTRQPRREEGLDESGEAPPPYVPKEPEPAYTRAQGGSPGPGNIQLHDMNAMDHKPPDYDEGPSSPPGRGPGPAMRGD
ncbi:MAG: hypothetical protein Q9178_004472 [Gyalolechia marmorata]